ncbi:isopentenyl-diphosphate Delta-isomerase 1 isoform X2 [Orussus abietinus]|nr:isopentenyl-diphosphate Delta-isomerase 1 isoform X2 [Orussus abietinus]XP_012275986.1 isopentenyl-diphosphate Delta-isomerase 1 isoform X2 [Orussus abietinus]XP_012275988.1 isopentenyl-diphosphate Delta-isomerase 1 isoform X2 [Orussus abietinus]
MLKNSQKLCTVVRKLSSSVRGYYAKMQVAPLQEAALEEQCILVDENDRILGEASKRYCHRVGEAGNIPLHRAFSVFMFNRKGDLLLQKRSLNKVTFPGHYTNTCCSHPLAKIPGEIEEEEALGVRRAAQRRLGYELGIPPEQVPVEDFFYLTRIHYQAPGDGYWGEHEIDYILFLRKDEVTVDPNPDEVSEIRWVSRASLSDFVKINSPLSPWFQLVLNHKLLTWWDNLDDLYKFRDHETIQRFVQ